MGALVGALGGIGELVKSARADAAPAARKGA
jgi:hypothetical protein